MTFQRTLHQSVRIDLMPYQYALCAFSVKERRQSLKFNDIKI